MTDLSLPFPNLTEQPGNRRDVTLIEAIDLDLRDTCELVVALERQIVSVRAAYQRLRGELAILKRLTEDISGHE